jgi:mannose-6-phosphate isomerase-like protein (cupin superfamily)
VGQVVANTATGERIVYRVLARDSAGELLRLEVYFALGSGARATHIHPHQEERFEIVRGRMRFRVGRESRLVTAGDVVVVPAGTPHRPQNVGDAEAHCLAEFRPALNSETFFENAFALLSARGRHFTVPMILELSELLSHYREEVRATPALLYLATAVAAPIGRAVGYRPRFPVEA